MREQSQHLAPDSEPTPVGWPTEVEDTGGEFNYRRPQPGEVGSGESVMGFALPLLTNDGEWQKGTSEDLSMDDRVAWLEFSIRIEGQPRRVGLYVCMDGVSEGFGTELPFRVTEELKTEGFQIFLSKMLRDLSFDDFKNQSALFREKIFKIIQGLFFEAGKKSKSILKDEGYIDKVNNYRVRNLNLGNGDSRQTSATTALIGLNIEGIGLYTINFGDTVGYTADSSSNTLHELVPPEEVPGSSIPGSYFYVDPYTVQLHVAPEKGGDLFTQIDLQRASPDDLRLSFGEYSREIVFVPEEQLRNGGVVVGTDGLTKAFNNNLLSDQDLVAGSQNPAKVDNVLQKLWEEKVKDDVSVLWIKPFPERQQDSKVSQAIAYLRQEIRVVEAPNIYQPVEEFLTQLQTADTAPDKKMDTLSQLKAWIEQEDTSPLVNFFVILAFLESPEAVNNNDDNLGYLETYLLRILDVDQVYHLIDTIQEWSPPLVEPDAAKKVRTLIDISVRIRGNNILRSAYQALTNSNFSVERRLALFGLSPVNVDLVSESSVLAEKVANQIDGEKSKKLTSLTTIFAEALSAKLLPDDLQKLHDIDSANLGLDDMSLLSLLPTSFGIQAAVTQVLKIDLSTDESSSPEKLNWFEGLNQPNKNLLLDHRQAVIKTNNPMLLRYFDKLIEMYGDSWYGFATRIEEAKQQRTLHKFLGDQPAMTASRINGDLEMLGKAFEADFPMLTNSGDRPSYNVIDGYKASLEKLLQLNTDSLVGLFYVLTAEIFAKDVGDLMTVMIKKLKLDTKEKLLSFINEHRLYFVAQLGNSDIEKIERALSNDYNETQLNKITTEYGFQGVIRKLSVNSTTKSDRRSPQPGSSRKKRDREAKIVIRDQRTKQPIERSADGKRIEKVPLVNRTRFFVTLSPNQAATIGRKTTQNNPDIALAGDGGVSKQQFTLNRASNGTYSLRVVPGFNNQYTIKSGEIGELNESNNNVRIDFTPRRGSLPSKLTFTYDERRQEVMVEWTPA